MTQYVVYDSTGTIRKRVVCPPSEIAANADGLNYLESEGRDDTHYVENGMVNVKLSMELEMPVNTVQAAGGTLTIGNVPNGTTVEVAGPVTMVDVVDDGEIVFATDTVGEYRLTLRHTHYITTEVAIHAT